MRRIHLETVLPQFTQVCSFHVTERLFRSSLFLASLMEWTSLHTFFLSIQKQHKLLNQSYICLAYIIIEGRTAETQAISEENQKKGEFHRLLLPVQFSFGSGYSSLGSMRS